jgi:hypothetical protein
VAGRSTTLTVRIAADAKGAAKGFAQAESKVEKFQRGLDKASVAAGGVIAGLAAFGKSAVAAASRLEQATGAVESVFGKQAKAVEKLAEEAAEGVGLSAAAYKEMASVMGAQLRNMGVESKKLAPKTNELIELGADLAATFGGETSDAVQALSSLLRGERDPIEKYGISIKAADVAARMAADGTDKLKGAQKKAAESAATLQLVMEQAKPAIGAFGREADTAAGRQQRLNAKMEDLQAEIGEKLLPHFTRFLEKLDEFITWVEENEGTVKGLVITIGSLAAAVLTTNAALRAYTAASTAATAAQALFNTAVGANPLVRFVVVALAAGAALKLLSDRSERVREAVNGTKEAIRGFFVPPGLQDLIDALKTAWQWLVDIDAKISSWATGGRWGDRARSWRPVGGIAGGGGLMGAAGGGPSPVYGAVMGTSTGGSVPASGGGSTLVNITVNGALDPLAVGRQIEKLLSDRARLTGSRVALTVGAR